MRLITTLHIEKLTDGDAALGRRVHAELEVA